MKGGARPGAGRPKGTENPDTKERRLAKKHLEDRVVKATDALINAQMQLAQGEQNLYRVYYTGKGSTRKKNVEIVTNQQVITEFLAGSLSDDPDEYYYIATKSPDNKSIDSLLDRTYGKAQQSIDMTTQGDKIQPATVIDLGALDAINQSETESSSTDSQES